MNKIMQSEKLLAAISFVPESAPFSPEQRAWLNGFFAGMTGIQEITGSASTFNDFVDESDAELEEDFPWKNESLLIDERMELATGRPLARQMMAAMAQLDCGSCGYVCQTYSEAIAAGTESNLTLCSPGGKETARALKKLVQLDANSPAAKPPTVAADLQSNSSSQFNRNHPFPAKLIRSEKLTGAASAKDVRHVEIDLTGSGLQYHVGDALGIYPTNCPTLIDDVLNFCYTNGSLDQHRALLKTRDLSAVTDALIESFTNHLSDENDKRKLVELMQDELALDKLDVLDFLIQFPTARIPDTQLVNSLPLLNPRLYSIASSLKAHANQVHLTVGKVIFDANNRQRNGVASTMLADRMLPGEEVPVFVQSSHGFTIPTDPNTSLIMVGPGTGIAPFISFLQERAATNARGKNWLFFGDQKSETDFLYQQSLQNYLQQGILTRLDTAFSRDQAHKIYVQDRMREQATELFQWLEEGASFYVCGDASRMAKDVDAALHELIARVGKVSPSAAKAYVLRLKSESRYCRDVY